MKILVVEDDQFIREGISEYLSEFGYDYSSKRGAGSSNKF